MQFLGVVDFKLFQVPLHDQEELQPREKEDVFNFMLMSGSIFERGGLLVLNLVHELTFPFAHAGLNNMVRKLLPFERTIVIDIDLLEQLYDV